jgi:thioredoxin reductase (NADPH)
MFDNRQWTCRLYGSNLCLKSKSLPVIYEGIQPGGQLTTTTEVENFPGYPKGISGPELMEDFKKQALRFNADIRSGFVTSADLTERPFKLIIDEERKSLQIH